MSGKVDQEDMDELAPIVRKFYAEVIKPLLPERFLETHPAVPGGLLGTGRIFHETVMSDLVNFMGAWEEQRKVKGEGKGEGKGGGRGGGAGGGMLGSSSSSRY